MNINIKTYLYIYILLGNTYKLTNMIYTQIRSQEITANIVER